MEIIEVVVAIATIIGGLVGIVQLIRWVIKPKVTDSAQGRPYLDVQIAYMGGQSRPLGISPRARPIPGENFFRADETLHVYENKKKISISIVNNSDAAALYSKLFVHKDSFKPEIKGHNEIAPIKPHETITLEAEHTEHEEKLPRERTPIGNFPSKDARDAFKLLVEYQNSNRKKYYTLFSADTGKNDYLEKMPDGFNVNSD